jgi:hypothetical protein
MMGADLSHIDTPTTPSILIGMKIGRHRIAQKVGSGA